MACCYRSSSSACQPPRRLGSPARALVPVRREDCQPQCRPVCVIPCLARSHNPDVLVCAVFLLARRTAEVTDGHNEKWGTPVLSLREYLHFWAAVCAAVSLASALDAPLHLAGGALGARWAACRPLAPWLTAFAAPTALVAVLAGLVAGLPAPDEDGRVPRWLHACAVVEQVTPSFAGYVRLLAYRVRGGVSSRQRTV
jgi:hypothetical protein